MNKGRYSELFDLKRYMVHGKSLENNFLGDPDDREVIVLERNVSDETPLLVGLPGFFGDYEGFLARSYTHLDFTGALRRIIRKNPDISFIIALPDTITSYSGNQYIDTPAVGNYGSFISVDLMSFLSETYGRRKTGLFGKSSGGFGAYSTFVDNTEKFDGFIDISGDSGFEYCYLIDFPSAIRQVRNHGLTGFIQHFRDKPNPTREELSAMNVLAMSAFYSPDSESELNFRLPFDIRTGRLDHEVWETWLKHDPLRTVEEKLDKLRGSTVILQTGSRDEYSIHIGMKGISEILREHSITHHYMEYDDGHFGINHFYEDSIPIILNSLSH